MEIRSMEVTFTNFDQDMVIEGRVNDLGWSKLLYEDGKRFTERIERGAFTKAIEQAKAEKRAIDLLGNHDKTMLLASTQNDSLRLEEREDGLYMMATISDTDYGRRFYTLLKDGLFTEMSFGFRVDKKDVEYELKSDGTYKRLVKALTLSECSLVRIGAYNETFAQLKARGIDVCNAPEFEEMNGLQAEIEVRSDLTIEELIDKAVSKAVENVKGEYEKIINDLSVKITPQDAPKEQDTSDNTNESEDKSVENPKDEDTQKNDTQNVDVSEKVAYIEKLKAMKGDD